MSFLLTLYWKLIRWSALSRAAKTEIAEDHDYRLLHALLRRFPYWGYGHVQAGEFALQEARFERAYLASEAAAILGHDSPQAKLLRVKVLLRYGKSAEARKILDSMPGNASRRVRVQVLEYKAAVELAEGNHEGARALLRDAPEKFLSPEAVVLRNFDPADRN